MPVSETQISAFVSTSTKDQIDRYTRATGVKKNHLIEEALLHHLLALRELPADVIVHPRIVVSAHSDRALAERLEGKPAPTPRLRALMSRNNE